MNRASILAGVSRDWWMLALRGAVAVLFAILAFLWPALTLSVLVLLWGAFAFVDGIFSIVAGARSRWWSILVFGLFGVAAGIATLFFPGVTALVLLMWIAAWAIVRGVLEIIAAVRLRRELRGEWLLIVGGAASIVFGVLMIAFPSAGAVAVVWLIALQALVVGIVELALAFRLRRISRLHEPRALDLGESRPGGPRIRA